MINAEMNMFLREKANNDELNRQLRIAVAQGKTDLIPELIKQGANPERRDSFSTYTLLMDVIVNSGDKYPDKKLIECLLQNGANPNAGLGDVGLIICGEPLDLGATCLMLLICRTRKVLLTENLKQIADLLFLYKADVHTKLKSNMTALSYAYKWNASNWANYILEKMDAAQVKTMAAEDKPVVDQYTEMMQDYLLNLESRKPTLAARLQALVLTHEEEEKLIKYQDPVHLIIATHPVRFNGRLFNLQTLLDCLGKVDPLSHKYIVTKNQIQPDWDSSSELELALNEVEKTRKISQANAAAAMVAGDVISPPGGAKVSNSLAEVSSSKPEKKADENLSEQIAMFEELFYLGLRGPSLNRN